MAVSKVLTAIYEPLFLPCSYGFRANKSCHDALRALNKEAYPCFEGAVVEIDLEKYFNTIPHDELRGILTKKITDKRFLHLIDKLITAPVMERDKTIRNERGCPQGSILSPILANIFLHEVIDSWFYSIRTAHLKGKAEMIRYADDMVFVFEKPDTAKRFYEVLPKRLAKYGLKLNETKSQILPSGQNHAARAYRQRKKMPTYHFVGFTVYWGKARNGKWWRMKFKSRRDRMKSKLQSLKQYLKKMQNAKGTKKTLKVVSWVLRGWINYHAVSDNQRCVKAFIKAARRLIWQWINRRGRKNPMSWKSFNELMKETVNIDNWKTTSIFSQKQC
jgi:group II intron reverse transcriptase/maturase